MEIFGIGLITLILGALGGGFIALKVIAPRTEAKWDDKILDVIEGVTNHLELDADDLAATSLGKLKKQIIKQR